MKSTVKAYIQLLRPKDWAKNLFLFLPLFFAGEIADLEKTADLLAGFLAFSLIASAVYIINDLRDVEDDRKHPVKRNRPLASGKISSFIAYAILAVLIVGGFLIDVDEHRS